MASNEEFLLILVEIAFLLNLADRVYILPKWAKDTQESCAGILIKFKEEFSITKETLKESGLLQPEGKKFLSLLEVGKYEWIKGISNFILFLIIIVIGELYYDFLQLEKYIFFNFLFIFCLVPFIFKIFDIIIYKWFLFGGFNRIEKLENKITTKAKQIDSLRETSNEDMKN